MPDYGERYADQTLKTIDKKLRATYATAVKELQKKLDDFNAKFAVKDARKRKELADGKITDAEYKDWLSGQVFIRGQWESKVKDATTVFTNHNREAAKIINEKKMDVFAENYNFAAYKGEKETGISFGVYNTQAVAKLIQDDPKILPEWKVDEQKDYNWNYDRVNNAVTQGIIQGESVPQITKRLCTELATSNKKRMNLFARTAITGAQNAGRQQQMVDAQSLGLRVKKRWIATLDSRTRDSHRQLDGQTVDVSKPFESIFGDIMYPGDPDADNPADIYNCRCTMETVYPDYEDGFSEDARRAYVEYEDEEGTHRRSYLTTNLAEYKEWKEAKMKQKPQQQPKQPKQVQKPQNAVEQIKNLVGAHSGEWGLDEIKNIGKLFAEEAKRQNDEKVKALQDKLDDLCRRLKEYEARDDYGREWADLYDQKFPLMKEIKRAKAAGIVDILKQIRPVGGVTKETLPQYADFTVYKTKTKDVKENLMSALNVYPTSWLERTKNAGISLKPHWSVARAYYSPSDGEIRISDRASSNIHELGHRMEYCVPGILGAENAFYKQRTDGEEAKWLGAGYSRSEVTRKDNFVDEYMGKWYDGKAFELVSMGFESVLSPTPRYDLTKDQDMYHWVLGLLAAL